MSQVVACTCVGAASSALRVCLPFDLCVIDEAAMALEGWIERPVISPSSTVLAAEGDTIWEEHGTDDTSHEWHLHRWGDAPIQTAALRLFGGNATAAEMDRDGRRLHIFGTYYRVALWCSGTEIADSQLRNRMYVQKESRAIGQRIRVQNSSRR